MKRSFRIPKFNVMVWRNGALQAEGKKNDYIVKNGRVVFSEAVGPKETIAVRPCCMHPANMIVS
jgi:hypothetical protein